MFEDRILIRDLEVGCVVGLLSRERGEAQRLIVDVDLSLDLEESGASERLSRSVDYQAVSDELTFLLQHCRFRMLETAAQVLLKHILAPPARGESRAQVKSAKVSLRKPQALGGVGVPAVVMKRSAEWVSLGHEDQDFGVVDIVHETKDAGVYRLSIRPGGAIPMHEHQKMDEAEYILTDGLLCQGKPAPRGSYRKWPKGVAHDYLNPTDTWQTVLCVDAPRFDPADEIQVSREAEWVPFQHYSERAGG